MKEQFLSRREGDALGGARRSARRDLPPAGGKETARRLAAALTIGKAKANPSVPICPVCQGDTFRFRPTAVPLHDLQSFQGVCLAGGPPADGDGAGQVTSS